MRSQLQNIYRVHRQALFSLAFNITGCRSLAEDAVHDAFVQICRRDAAPGGDPISYVFASVRNAAVDYRRRQTRDVGLQKELADGARVQPPLWQKDSEASPSHRAICAERNDLLLDAINQLDETGREIVILKIYGELTFEAIGKITEASPKTVESRYRRALTILNASLREQLRDQT